jgi:hypothetical protein
LLQAAREADVTRIKKHLSLEMVNFKHPQTHETALVMFQIFLKYSNQEHAKLIIVSYFSSGTVLKNL